MDRSGAEVTAAVIVPTCRRQALLPAALDAIDAQDAPEFEIVVVDDEPSEATRAIVDDLATRSRHPLRYLRTAAGGRGPARARNTGWRSTTAPLLVFTDDDCLPQPGWLRSLLAGLAEADVAQGCIHPNPTQTGRGRPFTRSLHACASPFFETANIGYRRDVLDALGGFDESFPGAAGEDTDLGHRALATSARVAAVPDAVVWHEVHPMSVRGALENAQRCDQLIRVVLRHPSLRRYFVEPLLLLPHHPRTIAATAGSGVALVGLARRQPALVGVGLAAAAPWLQLRGRRAPVVERRGRRVAYLPVQLGIELVEVAVILRARLRYRRAA